MNWLEEVREVLRGMNVDAVEMSDCVMVKIGALQLRLYATRQTHLYTCVSSRAATMIIRDTRSQIELIEDNLAARGWRVL